MSSRRHQRISAMVCLYQFFMLRLDMMEIFAMFTWYSPQSDDPILSLQPCEEDYKTMLIDAANFQEAIIDKINAVLNEWTFDRLGYIEQAILFLAFSELVYETADRAVIINEAIEITKLYCDEASYRLINGVLDQC